MGSIQGLGGYSPNMVKRAEKRMDNDMETGIM